MKQSAAKNLSQKADITIEFRIIGMSCSGCESIIENEIGKHNGVSFVKTPI